MYDVDCPYCDADLEIDHDGGYGYSEDETYEQECMKCGKTFVYTTSINYSYEAETAPCLNGEKHKFEIVTIYPHKFSYKRCSFCGEKQELTDDEWMSIGKDKNG